MKSIQEMPSIRKIGFETSPLSRAGIKLLATLPNLKKAQFRYVMPDQDIKFLKATLHGVELEIPYPESAEPR